MPADNNDNNTNDILDVTLLCKVVDNFGDVGVVYRLARALSDLCESLSLRIVIDNLNSFSLLEPQIDTTKDVQNANGWQILNWNAGDACLAEFRRNPPHIIVECFQCGRPEWLEMLLFTEKVENIVHIIMLDYLTAEDYAETFHKLQSLTRSARVQKVNFMPGFTAKTGGLILDEPFMRALKERETKDEKEAAAWEARSKAAEAKNVGAEGSKVPVDAHIAAISEGKTPFTALFFSYPRDWQPAVRAFGAFNKAHCAGTLHVLLARGAGYESFKTAYKNHEEKVQHFTLCELPFLPQTEWDALLTRTPLLFVRGEDSLSRACLCGVPFVWHAYPQTEEYQLVKVQALLERMRPFFAASDFAAVERCWQTYNTTAASAPELEAALRDFLFAYQAMRPGFAAFSASLVKNGDLAAHLLKFMQEQ